MLGALIQDIPLMICVFFSSSTISWKCKKQNQLQSPQLKQSIIPCLSLEIIWLCQLLLDFSMSLNKSTFLYVHNISAIQISTNPIHHKCTKHTKVDYHYIRELVQDQILQLHNVPS